MKTSAKVGGIIELEVHRADGSIEKIGKIHNVIGAALLPSERIPFNSSVSSASGVPLFATQTSRGKEALSGTFSQSGTTITRQSGSFNLSTITDGDLIVFSGGQRAYKTASIDATSCTVSKSQAIGTTTADRYKTNTPSFGLSPTFGAQQNISTFEYAVTTTYSNGVVTNTLASPRLFAAASTPYVFRCMSTGIYMSGGSDSGSFYDLPVDISINTGDKIYIASWTYTITFDDYLPRIFGLSLLTGVSGSGTYQRLCKLNDRENSAASSIWLLNNANKIVIPNMIAPSTSVHPISAASLNSAAMEIIVPSSSPVVGATFANNATQSKTVIGTVVTGGDVKQIIWGRSDGPMGIIEYDTPITLTAGKVITINTALQMEAELP